NQKGMLFSAGLITGEALVGVLIAVPIVLTHHDDVFALPPALQFGSWLGLLALAFLGLYLYRSATAPNDAQTHR
ncbi:MAG TPA: hypothetical protein VII70_05900, partial [Steroidobacteraceae bacterium]